MRGAPAFISREPLLDLVLPTRAYVDLWQEDTIGTLPSRYDCSVECTIGGIRNRVTLVGKLVTTRTIGEIDAPVDARRRALDTGVALFEGTSVLDVVFDTPLGFDDYLVELTASVDTVDGGTPVAAVDPDHTSASGFRITLTGPFNGWVNWSVYANAP